MEWYNHLLSWLGKKKDSSKDRYFEMVLEARVDIKGKEDLVGEEGRCMRAARRIHAYFSVRGYEREIVDLVDGRFMQDKFTRDGEVITQTYLLLPDPMEVKFMEVVWGFDCPEKTGQEHVGNLKDIYKEIGFDYCWTTRSKDHNCLNLELII